MPVRQENDDARSGFFVNVARSIADDIGSKNVLVIGNSAGLLVNALQERAIAACDETAADAGESIDLAVLIPEMKQSSDEIVAQAIGRLPSVSAPILLCLSLGDRGEPVPEVASSPLDWLSKFARHGFAPRRDYDPGFAAPSSILLERRQAAISDDELFAYANLVSARERWAGEFRALEKRSVDRVSLATAEHAEKIAEINDEHGRQVDRMEREQADLELAHARTVEMLQQMRQSSSWRMTAPYRSVGRQLGRVNRIRRIASNVAASRGGYWPLLKAAIRIVSRDGFGGASRAWQSASARGPNNDYKTWLQTYASLDDTVRRKIMAKISLWKEPPLISIVMPVYNPEISWLREAIESVQKQLYSNWELCIADDGSTQRGVKEFLGAYAAKDARIKVAYRPVNGHISEASNSALELATGGWMALLDQDDLLTEDALFYVARALIENPELELVYSDEDKIEDGRRFDPYFKTDWNVELLRSHNMVCHLGAFRMDRVKAIGGFRKGFEGSQDYDLVLRFSEGLPESKICHIPRVLYHWRSHSNSTAQTSGNKSYAAIAGQKALSEHLERLGVDATVDVLDTGMYRTHYRLPDVPPLVSLIIPTRNGLHLVKQCVSSILEKTTYPRYEIIIVDNNSNDPQTLAYFRDIQADPRIRVERDEQPFNYSALNNRAVRLAAGEFIGLINNDIEVISPDWLSEMMALAIQERVGAVGARLWYPDDRLQHGGVIIGLRGVAGHSHKMLGRGLPGYFRRAELPQCLGAVTAACLIVKKAIFDEVGGLNEVDLAVAFNDVDFCLKIQEAGYRNVWTPYADLYHHESATRGAEDTPEKIERFRKEIAYMHEHWETHIRPDPAYSANLTLNHEDFSLAWPPRNHQDPSLAS